MKPSKRVPFLSLKRFAAPSVLFLSLIACGETKQVNSGSEELATKSQATASAPTTQTAVVSAEQTLANITPAELDSLSLPMGQWKDDALVLESYHNPMEPSCPNFDIDGNGKIEMIKNGNSYTGDYAILQQAILSKVAGLPWPVASFKDLEGSGATRRGKVGDSAYSDYLNCLRGSKSGMGFQGPDRLDLNGDDKVSASDSVILGSAFLNVRYLSIKSAAKASAIERLNDDMNICYAYFKVFKDGTTAVRVMQQNCGIAPKTTLRRLPDLTVSQSGNNCNYAAGGVNLLTRVVEGNTCGR